jgi:putative ABC transport system permease protein
VRRIALRTLLHDRGRLAAAVTGVAFATALMLSQIGIYLGFRASASVLVHRIGGDLWVGARGVAHAEEAELLAAGTDLAARRHPCVAVVRPAVISWVPYRMGNGGRDTLQVVGVDLAGPTIVPWSFARGLPDDLRAPDRVALDVGALAAMRLGGEPLGAEIEVAGRSVFVAALTRGVRSLSLKPQMFTDVRTARRLLGASDGQATFWVLSLRSPACAASVARAVEENPALQVFPRAELARITEERIVVNSGAGAALAFVAMLGLVVAVVVVGQTLYATLAEHRRELGMLKAVGALEGELFAFVAWQVMFIAIVGGALGTLLGYALREAVRGLAIEIVLTPATVVAGLLAVGAACGLASIASLRVVRRLDPVEALR